MKKGDILTGEVVRTEFPNKGILYVDDKKITVKNALEGQTIQFSISKKKKNRLEGRLLCVTAPSPRELPVPSCPHFGVCGGCAYQNLPYEDQLALKKRQVEYLIRQAGFDFPVEEVLGSPVHEGYRNKMEYTFGDEEKDGPLTLGLHKRNSFYDIVPLSDCRIVDPDFNILLNRVLTYFKKEGKSFYHRMRHEGFLRHLVLRRSAKTGDILVNLVTSSQGSFDEKSFVDMILTGACGEESHKPADTNTLSFESGSSHPVKGRIAGILHTINDSLADVVKSDETRILYGQDYIEEYLFDMKFRITPFSFFQTNTRSAELVYGKVRDYAGDTKDKLIYDLYCGTGTISQILAPVARKVVGVEIVEEAVQAARQNAESNGLNNCEFIAGDVLKVLDNLKEKPDILVLDPPRDGINPKALKKIISYGIDELVYVSCKPTSLMRDLQTFKDAGYEVRHCCLIDQFPGTVHIETVVLLGWK